MVLEVLCPNPHPENAGRAAQKEGTWRGAWGQDTGSLKNRVSHLAAQEGFYHGNLFLGRMKAITKWPGVCVWVGGGMRESYGETWGGTEALTRMV